MALFPRSALLQCVMLMTVASRAGLLPGMADARSTRQPTASTVDGKQWDAVQTTPSGNTTDLQGKAPQSLDQPVPAGCANSSEASPDRTSQQGDDDPEGRRTDAAGGIVPDDDRQESRQRSGRSAGGTGGLGSAVAPDHFLIEWTVFGDWRVLVGLGAFEVVVYVVTVTVVMVLHSRQRNQVGSVRDGALTSKYQFTL